MASGPVIVHNCQVLLNKHGDDKFWKFCGGKFNDFTENLLDVARREFMEEMGCNFYIKNQDPFFYHTTKEIDGQIIDVVLVHFDAIIASNTGVVCDDIDEYIAPGKDIDEYVWLPLSDIRQAITSRRVSALNLAPNIIPALSHFGHI